jgi:hypothetical protein
MLGILGLNLNQYIGIYLIGQGILCYIYDEWLWVGEQKTTQKILYGWLWVGEQKTTQKILLLRKVVGW